VTLDARSLPYAPLVDTFAPALKGKLGGAITAQGHVTGAGITGAGLQKNLNGQFYVATTNLNLSVIDVKNPLIKGVINVIAVLPELVSNPTAAITSILGLGQNGGSLMTQLQQSPLQIITVRAIAGSGKINLDQTLVQSAAFQATAQGTITLNQVFTNSTLNIPVTIALSQSIATKLNLRGADTANATYVPMPQFLTMTGTLGNSKTDINHLALAGTVMKGVGSGVLNQVTDPNKPLGGLLNQLFKGKP